MRFPFSSFAYKPGFTAGAVAPETTSVIWHPDVRPRVSTLGCVLLLAMTGCLVATLMFSAFWSSLRSDLAVDAQSRIVDVEKLIDGAIADLDRAAPMIGLPCDAGGRAILAEQSLTSRAFNYLHWINLDTGSYCSALPGPQTEVTNSLARALEQTAGLDQALVLGELRGGVLIALPLTNQAGGHLVGEVTARQLAMVFSQRLPGGARAILYRWDGAVLNDSARLGDAPGIVDSRTLSVSVSMWPGGDGLRATAQSALYPVSLELLPSPVTVTAQATKVLLAFAVLTAVLGIAVIALINAHLARRSSIERRLRLAMMRKEFEPVIQPIVDAQTGRCRGGEVLVRWRHPTRGELPPSAFLASAERMGLMGELTLMIMTRARDQLAPVVAVNPSLYVSFNVEAPQLRDPIFLNNLEEIFEGSELSPDRVVIELVEREAVDAQARVALSRLRKRGYRIAIDDFGTGQSSLALLSSIEFDMLKIDRSFVVTAGDDEVTLPVLDAILDMAQKLGVSTIAEGVETRAQHGHLVSRGVTAIQGYVVARPMQIASFSQWLYARASKPGYASSALADHLPGYTANQAAAANTANTHQRQSTVQAARSVQSVVDRAQAAAAQAVRRSSQCAPGVSSGRNGEAPRSGRIVWQPRVRQGAQEMLPV